MRRTAEEVIVADAPLVRIGWREVEFLKHQALTTPRARMRLCAHRAIEDRLHQMVIVHPRGAYIRPHKHLNKPESIHVLEGMVDVVVFDERGGIWEVVPLGGHESGRDFFCRLPDAAYHTLMIRSDVLVFLETTNGPFRPSDTVAAEWSPEEGSGHVETFVERLDELVGQWRSA